MHALDSLRAVVRFGPFERDATRRKLQRVANIDDLRALAKRRLPEGVFDYIDGGAEDELTLAANTNAFRAIGFRPRVLVDVSKVSTEATLFGKALAFPLVLSPTGFTRIATPDGELAVTRVAERVNVPYSLSTLATRSIEDVAHVANARKFFQVYMWRDRGLVAELLERARVSGYEAIMLTVDTAVFGRRERDVRRGFTLPPKVGLQTLFDGIRRPRWSYDLVRSEPITFANVRGAHAGDGSSAVSLATWIDEQFDPTLSWRDIEWLRARWSGPIMLKGVATPEDATIVVQHGIDALALSNHGGRQLDGAPTPIEALPGVLDAINSAIPVLVDGGIRRGSDLAKALALGASAGMVGRAYLYGLGAAGEAGVETALSLLQGGLARTMALLGVNDIAELGREHVRVPSST